MFSVLSLRDARLVHNKFTTKKFVPESPGLKTVDKKLMIVPSQMLLDGEQSWASVILSAREMLDLIKVKGVSILAQADTESQQIPEIAQRIPTESRTSGILESWHEEDMVVGKLETLRIFVFNATVTSEGIVLGPDSLLILSDGGGRAKSVCQELEDLVEQEEDENSHVCVTKNIRFQLNLNLSGVVPVLTKDFLSHNRDQKRATTSTTLCAEVALVGYMSKRDINRLTYEDNEFPAFVIRELSALSLDGSIVELLRWDFEGAEPDNKVFKGKGKISTIRSALKDRVSQSALKRSGIAPKDFVSVLDFGFRAFYKMCPTSVNRAHAIKLLPKNATPEQRKQAYQEGRICSSLGVKTMIYLLARVYPHSGMNFKKFAELVNEIVLRHFKHHKDFYANSKSKKMNLDRFWQESNWIAADNYNAGKVNAEEVRKQLAPVCDDLFVERPAIAAQIRQ